MLLSSNVWNFMVIFSQVCPSHHLSPEANPSRTLRQVAPQRQGPVGQQLQQRQEDPETKEALNLPGS